MEVTIKVHEGINLAPQYYKPHYCNNNFVQVNKCKFCGMIGLYEDMHPVNPCTNCGGKVTEYGGGKWVDGHWVVRTK